jgi:hypothetical protein
MNNFYTHIQIKILKELIEILIQKDLSTLLNNGPNHSYVEYDRKLTDLYNEISEYLILYEKETRENDRYKLN